MIKIRQLKLIESCEGLAAIPEGKQLINTVNAYSYNNARKDEVFAEALMKGDFLLPDGISIVKACQILHYAKSQPKERVTGWDLFAFKMKRLNEEALNPTAYWKQQNPQRQKPVVMFMGSTQHVLDLIKKKASIKYPNLEVKTYSPPYKPEFTVKDNRNIISAIHAADPDLLWIGMTAPKQEKWAYGNWDRLHIHCNCGAIGAVFDFFAGTSPRAPEYWQNIGMEWMYRLLLEPKRMWRRYIIGNTIYIYLVFRDKIESFIHFD